MLEHVYISAWVWHIWNSFSRFNCSYSSNTSMIYIKSQPCYKRALHDLQVNITSIRSTLSTGIHFTRKAHVPLILLHSERRIKWALFMVSELTEMAVFSWRETTVSTKIQRQQHITNQMCCDLVILTLKRFSNHQHYEGPKLRTGPEEFNRFLYYSACLPTLIKVGIVALYHFK